jgi:hypothetical protein
VVTKLAVGLAVRKTTVLRELRGNPRFEQLGHGRGSSWRLAGNRYEPPWEPQGPNHGDGSGKDIADRLAAVDERLTAVERRLASIEAPTT